ncbi:unnamed protein product [Cylicocyclus nassatus]|uniref:Tetraspanin n=1 Tax=Cylicocyclus nassatus TaxID=53992 RepID=A0AA36HDS3_CYLNA|nr:unnamed protein product [Cylicocyclus nassatus]
MDALLSGGEASIARAWGTIRESFATIVKQSGGLHSENFLVPQSTASTSKANGTTTPLLTPLPTFGKQSVSLVRGHPKVYLAICYQLAELMLAAGIIICSIYVKSQALTHISRRIQKLHVEIEFLEELIASMTSSTRMYGLFPFIGGVVMAIINVLLIYQCFQYGINISSNLCGIAANTAIAFLLFSGSFLVLLDVSRYPNDIAGVSKDNIYLLMHFMRVAIHEQDPFLNSIIQTLHEQLKCCGFHSVNDYYTQRQIDYPPPSEGTNLHSFRMSNRWIRNCSFIATEDFNATHICYAPRFCCADNKDGAVIDACPPFKWDGTTQLSPSSKMYRHSCAWRVARNFHDKAVNITILSVTDLLVIMINGVYLLRWRSRMKPPP